MRVLSARSFSPCLICLSLVIGALAIDDLGAYGRLVGVIMITAALWGPDLLIARGWAAVCSTATDPAPPVFEGSCERSPAEVSRPWWMRPYAVRPLQMLLLGALGGAVIGCTVPLYLNEPHPRSLLTWGATFGVLGLIFAATARLLDEGHPHHSVFMASVRHASRFFFVGFYALGFWQSLPPVLIIMLSGGPCALILFTLGTVWSLALAGQAAVHSSQHRSTLQPRRI
jgi:hypothetical protein